MKILQIGRHYWPDPGGMERALHELSEGLVNRGHQVQCWVSHHKPQTTEESLHGVHIVRFPSVGQWTAAPLSFWSREYLEQFNPDIIHFHLPNLLPTLFYREPSRPTVVTYHSDPIVAPWLAALYNRAQKKFIAGCDAVVVSSQRAYESSQLRNWSLKEKIRVIPFGIDEKRLMAPTPLPVPEVDILFVGPLRAYKGLDHLIYAMEGIDARLVIIGRGEEERRLRSLVKNLNLERQVKLLGQVPDIEVTRYLRATKVVVLPSLTRHETFSFALLEAMACGKPMISTHLPTDVLDINMHGLTGIVVPAGNVPRLRECLQRVLRDPAQRERLGQQARRHFEAHFRREPMVDAHERLYQQLVSPIQTVKPHPYMDL